MEDVVANQTRYSRAWRYVRRRVTSKAWLAGIAATSVGFAASAAAAPQLFIGHPGPAACGGKTYTIGVDYFSTTEAFSLAWLGGVKRAAAKTHCVKIVALTDNADATTAVANAQTFVEEHVNGVILLQVVAAAQPGVMNVLDAAHIPAVATAVPAPGATFVSTNDYNSGFAGGVALGKAYKKTGNSQKPYLLMGAYPEGGPLQLGRTNGVIAGIKSVVAHIPHSHILQIDTDANPVTTHTDSLTAISKIPSGAPILASAINDENVFAEFQAIKQSGRLKHALLMGINGDPTGLKIVCEHPQYVGTVGYTPERWGNYAVPVILDVLQHKAVPPKIPIPHILITRKNMRSIYPSGPC
jgi:ribose transport system substrate-binding protein